MSLKNKLDQITASGFKRMPRSIAKVLEDGIEELKTNGLKYKALSIGDSIPDMSLLNSNKETVFLKDYLQNDFLILNFYRGGWCPYCNLELRAYEQLKSKFKELGADIIGISPELPDLTKMTSVKNELSFPVLTDLYGKLAKEIGIGFHLNKDLKREYSNFGINLDSLHGNDQDELLVPAVYVIDKNQQIIFVHLEENYMTRIEPQEVLDHLTLTQAIVKN